MRSLFTVHVGEYLVGAYIERHYKRVRVWIPSKDTGLDLLLSDHQNCRMLSLQVKFSNDYLATDKGLKGIFQKKLRACGWWTIKPAKLEKSEADLWVLVLPGLVGHTTDYVIVPTGEYRRRLRLMHGSLKKRIDTYLWVTEDRRCWETRGLVEKYRRQIAEDEYQEPRRDFTKWLNNWSPVAQLNRQQARHPTTGDTPQPSVQAALNSDPVVESEGGRASDC